MVFQLAYHFRYLQQPEMAASSSFCRRRIYLCAQVGSGSAAITELSRYPALNCDY